MSLWGTVNFRGRFVCLFPCIFRGLGLVHHLRWILLPLLYVWPFKCTSSFFRSGTSLLLTCERCPGVNPEVPFWLFLPGTWVVGLGFFLPYSMSNYVFSNSSLILSPVWSLLKMPSIVFLILSVYFSAQGIIWFFKKLFPSLCKFLS